MKNPRDARLDPLTSFDMTNFAEKPMLPRQLKQRAVASGLALPLLAFTGFLLPACSDESAGFPSAEGRPTPYILKEDCKFTIVEELSRAGITSPEVKGMPGATGSASISLGARSITVSDCKVTANSHSLPIYEQ